MKTVSLELLLIQTENLLVKKFMNLIILSNKVSSAKFESKKTRTRLVAENTESEMARMRMSFMKELAEMLIKQKQIIRRVPISDGIVAMRFRMSAV